MRQKDIRTRVAEIEAEAKAPVEGMESEEEDEESSKIATIVPIVTGLIMAGIFLYMLMAILPELIKEIK